MALRATLAAFANSDPRNLRTHPGLWIDKMIAADEPNSASAAPHLKRIVRPPVPDGYEAAFALRERTLSERADEGRAILLNAEATGRLVVGLGAKGVLELGITLDHTWGVPYLPGSALKGVAASAAHRFGSAAWRKPDGWPAAGAPGNFAALTDFQALFGTTGNAGAVVFHDAWWDPVGQTSVPLELDVMTVHHPDYYQREAGAAQAPTDFDEPFPVPFLSGTGKFVCALEGPPAWVEAAEAWLELGLDRLGLGAKTSSGYGRFQVSRRESDALRQRRAAGETLTTQLRDFQVNRLDSAVTALVRAARTRVAPRDIGSALARVEGRHRSTLVERAKYGLDDDARASLDTAFAEAARPTVPTAVPPSVEAPTRAAKERTEIRTRAVFEPDKKSEKRYAVRLVALGKSIKGQFLDVEATLLDKIKATGDNGLEVVAVNEEKTWRLRPVPPEVP